MSLKTDFWRHKPLAEMNSEEWEALCDGCGKCCLHKLQDDESGEIAYTNIACRLLDLKRCRCRHYRHRHRYIPDCIALTPKSVTQFDWLPASCAYRLIANGEELPPWHYLRSGDEESIHLAGASVRGWAISETDIDALEEHIITWQP